MYILPRLARCAICLCCVLRRTSNCRSGHARSGHDRWCQPLAAIAICDHPAFDATCGIPDAYSPYGRVSRFRGDRRILLFGACDFSSMADIRIFAPGWNRSARHQPGLSKRGADHDWDCGSSCNSFAPCLARAARELIHVRSSTSPTSFAKGSV